jgi:hypothetical protein
LEKKPPVEAVFVSGTELDVVDVVVVVVVVVVLIVDGCEAFLAWSAAA